MKAFACRINVSVKRHENNVLYTACFDERDTMSAVGDSSEEKTVLGGETRVEKGNVNTSTL